LGVALVHEKAFMDLGSGFAEKSKQTKNFS